MGVDPAALSALEWRCIGPPRGGRVVAVAGHPRDPMVFYFGACAGGVWKTTDGGTYWENVSGSYFETASVGAIAVSDSDPDVIYVGMGESCIRLDVSHGDGVYKSEDGGQTWTNLGLRNTRHIARVRVHPEDPNLVYVAALGHAFGPDPDRGVFRSKGGGKTWEKVLSKSDRAGAIDISIASHDPRVIYASLWQTIRRPWTLESGGPDSGIYRSTDGGDTWTDISDNPGLPKGIKGRIGVAASPARPGRVWATIEADKGGVYRSDDEGDTWELVSDQSDLRARPWYYQHIFADPQDPQAVWVLNYKAWKSLDGGETFNEVTTPHGDNHDLWIDPLNPLRMIEGNDGGACVSFNGGLSWSTIYNQMTAQFYHITTDNQFPYRIYGTQQDNSSICVPSRSNKGGIPWGDCYAIGGSESGHIAVHPENHNIVISGAVGSSPGGGGNLLRYDRSTDQVRIITVWPELNRGRGAMDMKYRFAWTFPILFSQHDSDVLYVGGNRVFKSLDQGASWAPISSDLTRDDVTKLGASGGPITKDTSGAEVYCTVFALAESPLDKDVLWAGSDDGLVHVTRDGAQSWQNVTPEDISEWSLISNIEPSCHDPGAAYLAATRYKLDDPSPMLYRTVDYGQTWTKITSGIPEADFTRVVREDPDRQGLLYAGTETGVYISIDAGESWQGVRTNLPVVPIYDLAVKNGDLIAATHGRSLWILDDLTLLHQLNDDRTDLAVRLFKPRPTYKVTPSIRMADDPGPGKNYELSLDTPMTYVEKTTATGETEKVFLDAGKNPPDGAIINYFLPDQTVSELRLEVITATGVLIRSFSSDANQEPPRPTSCQGMNRFVWDLRYPPARKVPEDKSLEKDLSKGPLAPAGDYTVRLTVGGEESTESFQVLKDPSVAASQEEMEAQFGLLMRIRDRLSETHDAVVKIQNIRVQIGEKVGGTTSGSEVAGLASDLNQRLGAIEEALIQVDYKGQRDRLHLPVKLNEKLAELAKVVASADFAPTKQAVEVFEELSEQVGRELAVLESILNSDLAGFNDVLGRLGIPEVTPSSE